MDVEAASASIDALIGRRSRMEEQSRAEEMAWKASVAAFHEKRDGELREEWRSYHLGQAERLRRTLGELIAQHEASAAAFEENGRKETG